MSISYNESSKKRKQPIGEIESPSHYTSKNMEVIDVIDAFDLDFNTGNIIKYVLRAGKKDDELKDLSKANYYLKRKINKLKQTEN